MLPLDDILLSILYLLQPFILFEWSQGVHPMAPYYIFHSLLSVILSLRYGHLFRHYLFFHQLTFIFHLHLFVLFVPLSSLTPFDFTSSLFPCFLGLLLSILTIRHYYCVPFDISCCHLGCQPSLTTCTFPNKRFDHSKLKSSLIYHLSNCNVCPGRRRK